MNNILQKKPLLKYLLLTLTIAMLFFSFNKNEDYNNLKTILLKDKEDLQLELNEIVKDYNHLNIKNKKLSKRVIIEINKIIALTDSVKKLDVKNFDMMRVYRKKLSKLQKENRVLITKVDSLNVLNHNLREENILTNKILVKKDIVTKKLEQKNKNLIAINHNLETKITPAKQIRTSSITAIAMKERNSGKLASTKKHNKTDALKINFKLLKNDLATPGYKKIYIQVKDKNNTIIAVKEESIVLDNNLNIRYSDELIAHYKNEDINVLSLILVDRESMEKGEYQINVFVDGGFSASSLVSLK